MAMRKQFGLISLAADMGSVDVISVRYSSQAFRSSSLNYQQTIALPSLMNFVTFESLHFRPTLFHRTNIGGSG
jgi:hypothetical protein